MKIPAMSEQNRIGTLNSLEKKLLMSFIEHTKTHDFAAVHSEDIFGIAKASGIPAAIIDPAIKKLVRNNFLAHEYNDNNLEKWYTISEDFYDEAIPYYLDERKEKVTVPASDRFVSISDNQPEVASAKAALDELSNAILKTNDPLTTNPEDRLLLSKQIDAIKELIGQPRIHLAALYDVVNSNSTLKFLVTQTVTVIVQQAAINALESLTTLWQHVSSLL